MDKSSTRTHRAKIFLGVTIAFLIASIFPWFTLDVGSEEVNVSLWSGLGNVAGVLAIGLVVWQFRLLSREREPELEIGADRAMPIAALALIMMIFTFIRFTKQSPEVPSMDATADSIDRTYWAWLGLALALVVAVGAWISAWMNTRAVSSGS